MNCLIFSGEAPHYGGYAVTWQEGKAPAVSDCRLEVTALVMHQWQAGNHAIREPGAQSLSWRVVDGDGDCVAEATAEELTDAERAWLATLDLQISKRKVRAPEPQDYLLLLVGRMDLPLDEEVRGLLEQSDGFVDYHLALVGPDDELLLEKADHPDGAFSLREKHEGLITLI
jgi:hypothetical protein